MIAKLTNMILEIKTLDGKNSVPKLNLKTEASFLKLLIKTCI